MSRTENIFSAHKKVSFTSAYRFADSSECLGQCRAQSLSTPQQSEATQVVKGHCQANNIPFGCYSEIIGGTAQPGLCVD